ncbi:ABC transporter substrate-binding protein [Flavobacteriaceae bacterium F89]|uniref:ABC transporter substrate-binding protein n=1 Tax=Cerina litoralis TaxID=2874477 RepID=A0AAE3EX34_9FLAO|nr:substrate-binding domain-containing protein [Cerina litoralis]MCG2461317.1 ABC transporter substrate-binding protein [Cerina litoralis]
MKTVKIIGVPEHFNFPWQLAIEEGAFEERGIDLQWTEIPEGTGKMCQMLKDYKTDLAIILTEGIIKSITEGNPVKIVQEYVSSPLLWGIHVDAKSGYGAIPDLEGTKVAISRFGSGSHLMAFLHAQEEGWDSDKLQFVVVDNLDGAVLALTEGRADYFMWEHFMTKPLVDKEVFRRLGDCPTPWPSFVIVATDKFLRENKSTLRHILEIINRYTVEFKNIPSIDRTLANTFDQQPEDIREWLSLTRWSQTPLNIQTIELVQDTLFNLKLIDKKLGFDKIVENTQ